MSFSSDDDDEDFVMESLLDFEEDGVDTTGNTSNNQCVGMSTWQIGAYDPSKTKKVVDSSESDDDFVIESLLDFEDIVNGDTFSKRPTDSEENRFGNSEINGNYERTKTPITAESDSDDDFVMESLLDFEGDEGDDGEIAIFHDDIELPPNKNKERTDPTKPKDLDVVDSFTGHRDEDHKRSYSETNGKSPSMLEDMNRFVKSKSLDASVHDDEDLGICYTTINHEEEDKKALPSLVSYWSNMKTKKMLSKTLSSPTFGHWFDAIEKAKHAEDPWSKHNIIETCPSERAKRFRYNALKKKWIQDMVVVKMQNEPFGSGAMRQCFRMKKLSTMVHSNDWSYASNIVAKKYFEDVLPKTYFDDVKLQMDAKLWAEEYNRHNPPKKVDIIQVGCIKLIDREGAPMYHIEHFVEGKYVKYNSNSGFVLKEDDTVRATPQAFSHFTFERSGHQMIVVDVQGVGDLYTDPQIHTTKLDEYGEANLGMKGMALFFASHDCSQICEDMSLERFNLSEKEKARLQANSSRSSTATEVIPSDHHTGKMEPIFDLVERLQSVSSVDSGISSECSDSPKLPVAVSFLSPRHRMYSEGDSTFGSEDDFSARERFFNKHQKKESCIHELDEASRMLSTDTINNRLSLLENYEEEQVSILSQVHYELALYNYIGRFTENTPDMESVLFHLDRAAMSGCLKAAKILGYKYSQLSTVEFEDLQLDEDHDRAFGYFIEAATRGDKDCMIKTAQAFDTGSYIGSRKISWKEALKWYETALKQYDKSECNFASNPNYEINARMAEIWRTGGNGVDKDASYAGELYTTAAEEAMNAGKGKLSNKYYMLAEEAWGEVEE